MEGMARNWSRGWLMPLLLLVISKGAGGSGGGSGARGQDLMSAMAGFGLDALRPAAAYRALRRMEKEGMVLSGPLWGQTGGGRRGFHDLWPSRRRYEITESGEAYLAFWADALDQYREETEMFLDLYAGRPDAGRSSGRDSAVKA